MSNMEHDDACCGDCSPLERRHIAITRADVDVDVDVDVVVRQVHVVSGACGETTFSATSITQRVVLGESQAAADCFDPAVCCDAHEQAMIAALRAYLRPESAPECLMARLKETLDRCCRCQE